VWQTTEQNYFTQLPDITVSGGSFSLTLRAASIYSITTTTGQSKFVPKQPIPEEGFFPFPYSDNFDNVTRDQDKTPRYFSDQGGIYVVTGAPDNSTNGVLKQVIPIRPIPWGPDPNPYTLLGDSENWKNYRVSVDFYLELPISTVINAEISKCSGSTTQQWKFDNSTGLITSLANGNYCLTVVGTDSTYNTPNVGVATCNGTDTTQKWSYETSSNHFINLGKNMCMDIGGASTSDYANVILWACKTDGSTNQQWSVNSNNTITSKLDGDCLEEIVPKSYVQLCGRVHDFQGKMWDGSPPPGYCISIEASTTDTSNWVLYYWYDVVKSGTTTTVKPQTWHHLSLTLNNNFITPSLDNKDLITGGVQDTNQTVGMVALASGYHVVYFDNFKVESL